MWKHPKKRRSSLSRDESGRQILKEEEKIPESSATKVDALTEFFSSVESAFGGRNSKYTFFRHSMNDLRRGREVDQARSRIEEMLNEHQELLAQFKTLFPELERGEVLNPPQDVDIYEQTFQFYFKVKARFHGGKRFGVFRRILLAYSAGTKNPQEVYNEMKEVFKDNPDLLEEFTTFLP